ncbi:MAG: hypothetical protein MN733_16305 [Nitrososphaera sp.]|nr:hypothetical protein [Nitrososphaera sp.]
MAGKQGMERGLQTDLLEYLRDTPKALVVVVASFISGHLWVFMITAFIRSKTKGNNLLQSTVGRTTVGLIWLTGVLVPFYCLKFREFSFDYERILQIAIPTVVTGLFIQLILFAIFVSFGDRK